MYYEFRSRAEPAVIVCVNRALASIDVQPTEEEVRRQVSENIEEKEIQEICSKGWERVVSRTSWAQAPGYQRGGKGSKGGYNAKHRG